MADDSGAYGGSPLGTPWWELEDPDDACAAMCAVALDLRSRDESRRTAIRVWDDFYDGRTVALFGGLDSFGLVGRDSMDAPVYNISRNVVDFVHAKVTADMPTVMAQSHDGDWREQRRAVRLTRFLHGTFEAGCLQDRMAAVAKGALRMGTGCLKVVVRDGRIVYEPTSGREFLVDPDDARHMDPRVLYQVKPVDRLALEQQFPEHADEIRACGGTPDPLVGGLADPWSLAPTSPGSAVDLHEAWLLPRFGLPGRHLVGVRGCHFIDEPWDDPRFPVCFLRPMDPRDGGGMWGQGFVERLVPAQYAISEEIAAISLSQRVSAMRVFVEDGAEISDESIQDPAIGNIIRYRAGATGGIPVFMAPTAVSEQRIQWVQELIDWTYAQFGMSEQAASSMKSPGINSGRALLVYHDITTLRHVDLAKRIGQLAVDVAERTIDAARRLSEDDPGWEARYDGPGGPESVDWSSVDMDREMYVLSLEQASAVPDTFAGHVQMVEQDVSEGRIPSDYLLQLRQDPDIERRWDVASRDGEFVDWTVEQLLEPDRPMPPIPDEAPKGLLVDRLRAEILAAIMAKNVDDRVPDRLQRYAAELVASMPPPPAPQTGPSGSPPSLSGPPGPPAPGPAPMPMGGIAPAQQ